MGDDLAQLSLSLSGVLGLLGSGGSLVSLNVPWRFDALFSLVNSKARVGGKVASKAGVLEELAELFWTTLVVILFLAK